jgi:hypothetical protein
MFTSVLLIALAGQAQAPASAPPSEEQPILVQGKKQADQNCRRTRETGSHLVKMICRSDAEQRAINTNARNVLKLGNVNPNSPGSSPAPTEK